MKSIYFFSLIAIVVSSTHSFAQKSIPLFNQKNLRGWYAFEPETGKHQQGLEVFAVENKMIRCYGKKSGYLMSKKSFDKLNPKQKEAILAAGKKAEQYITKESALLDSEMEKVFKEKGVQIHQMTEADFNAWIELAKKTSYKKFAEKVKGGDKLIEKALAVK